MLVGQHTLLLYCCSWCCCWGFPRGEVQHGGRQQRGVTPRSCLQHKCTSRCWSKLPWSTPIDRHIHALTDKCGHVCCPPCLSIQVMQHNLQLLQNLSGAVMDQVQQAGHQDDHHQQQQQHHAGHTPARAGAGGHVAGRLEDHTRPSHLATGLKQRPVAAVRAQDVQMTQLAADASRSAGDSNATD